MRNKRLFGVDDVKAKKTAKSFRLPDIADPVPFSLWQLIVNQYGEGETERILYRVWKRRPAKVAPYIRAGLRGGWLINSVPEEYHNPEAVNAWIRQVLRRERRKAKQGSEPEKLGELLKGVTHD